MIKYLLAIVNYIPVIGHIKGFIHKLYGNKVAAIHASFAATRTTTILAAGAGGFFVGGPPAAIICGTLAGMQWDLGAILPSYGNTKNPDVVDNKPNTFKKWIDGAIAVATQGIMGVFDGRVIDVAKDITHFVIVKTTETKGEESNIEDADK
jgi:hypothetical protein